MTTGYKLQTLPIDERPRERLQKLGPEALSNAELLALILGSGMRGKSVIQLSQELLAKFGGLDQIAEATISELCEVKGLGKAKAIQLRALSTLATRLAKKQHSLVIKVDHPQVAYHLIKEELETLKKEVFIVLLLDTKANLIKWETVSIGTLSRSLVHPREVFYPAIRHKAASLILAHNHPSGDPTPSKQDIEVTKKLIETGKLLGIPVQDHLIIGRESYQSLRQSMQF